MTLSDEYSVGGGMALGSPSGAESVIGEASRRVPVVSNPHEEAGIERHDVRHESKAAVMCGTTG